MSIRATGILRGSAPARAQAQERLGSQEPKPALYLAAPIMSPPTRGAQRRFARQLREATLRATPTEHVDLERLERLVGIEAIGIFEAQALLRDVLRRQHERHQAQAA